MNHRHIARKYLAWFAGEAEKNAAEGSTHYASGTDHVERYRDRSTGVLCNAMVFVGSLATSRLAPADVEKVREEARKLLRPDVQKGETVATTDQFLQNLPPGIHIVPRSRHRPEHQFTVQSQAPAGNWVDVLRSPARQTAIETAVYYRDTLNATVRIVDEFA